jgi:uncharacterized membrane protein YkvA (DUF1232 family)
MAYFILPADTIPEDVYGPYGYVDDICLCAFVADRVRDVVGSDAILLDNWEGEAPLVPLIRDVLAQEAELIGDQRGRILGYIGYEYLVDAARSG